MTELIDRNRIAHAHWQMRLGTFADPATGEIAAGLDDLEQAINIVVLTEKGTVPLQPEMCCRLLPWIDKPPADAIPNFTREIWDALATWEPRIVVTKVAPIARGFAHWAFPVFWYPRADVAREIRMTEVVYGKA